MSAGYEPRPGTVAFRVLAHLETLPAGAEVMTSALAEAINAEASQIQPCLELALKAGQVFRRQKDDHIRSPWWWSLTDHSGIPKVRSKPAFVQPQTPAPEPEPKPPRTVEEAWQRQGKPLPSGGITVAPIVGPMVEFKGKPPSTNPSFPMAREHPEEFRAALWSNGFLQIERFEGDLVILTREHVEQLRALLGGGR